MTWLPAHSTVFSNPGFGRPVTHMRYAIVIEEADNDFSVYAPDLPGGVAMAAVF
jgi:hypothetical protein